MRDATTVDDARTETDAKVGDSSLADATALDAGCDGAIDGACPCREGTMQACGNDHGICTFGMQTCSEGKWGACMGGTPPGTETCNGFDDDCDATTDEGLLTNLAADNRITDEANPDDYVALGWSGSQFGLFWSRESGEDIQLYYRALNAFGSPLSAEKPLTTKGIYTSASAAWNPTAGEFGIVASRNYDEVVFIRVKADGTLVGTEVSVAATTGTQPWPWVAWNGNHWGVVWHESGEVAGSDIHFALLEPDGTVVRKLPVTATESRSRYGNVVWNGTAWGVVWADDRVNTTEAIYFSRISADGKTEEVNDQLVSGPGRARWPNLEHGPGGFAVTWHGNASGADDDDVYLSLFDEDGRLQVGSPLPVTTNLAVQAYASVDWTGNEYLVAWHDARDGDDEIYYAQVGVNGVKNSMDQRVTNAAGNSQFATAIWTGEHFGVGWRDARDGNDEIYFTYVGCP